ncbi:hypothetical protein JP75_25095 [Devosia riboflavina]|uniref:Valyl-tRNA synthetase n=1 Tax=Devosia riboflavina TaxID=46914 RepID=A0A087LTK1_9HYPH|nr:DUF4287 domain-containing protein [Devosia riboflavina]KFL27954.1 hypothetical protein JP75_25095 [Devosia riboflavina]
MTFAAYLSNIEKQTGVSPDEFIRLATEKGFTTSGTKATAITDWLKADYKLGHGHAMAIYKLLKEQDGLTN